MVEKNINIPLNINQFKKIKIGDSLYHIRGEDEHRMEADVTATSNGGDNSVVIRIDSIVVDSKNPVLKNGETSIAFVGEIFRRK